MAEIIKMPKLGFDMQEGTFAAWVKQVGEQINSGEVIAEIETDKATVEVETYTAGTLLQVMAQPGDVIEVGAPIAVVGEQGEDISGLAGGNGNTASAAAAPAETRPPATSQTQTPVSDRHEGENKPAPTQGSTPIEVTDKSNGVSTAPVAEPEGNGRLPGGVKASPLARRLAEQKGVDLKQVHGSGPGGRIIREDVENFKPGAAPATSAPAATPAPAASAPAIGGAPSYRVMDVPNEVIELTRLRGTIARRMVESKQNVPHFTVTISIDTSALLKLRKQINDKLDEDHKVTVNDLIIKATALTLRQFPNLNTHFHGDKLIRYTNINIGIAVALPQGGLMNVVARNADITSLSAMAAKNKTMIASAREGKVKPDDIEGSTFTVSNLGAFGVDHFTAIINPPEAGILAIGASQQTPVVNKDGEISIGNIMKVTISVDHRTSDGAEGAQFLQAFKALIEDPLQLLV
jgi:pyruvate dehydrogenase E2 component (dihydrolipoamide acetyltransferase)